MNCGSASSTIFPANPLMHCPGYACNRSSKRFCLAVGSLIFSRLSFNFEVESTFSSAAFSLTPSFSAAIRFCAALA